MKVRVKKEYCLRNMDHDAIGVETAIKTQMSKTHADGAIEQVDERVERLTDAFAKLVEILRDRGKLYDSDVLELLGTTWELAE